jgi:hypothetical protein
MQYYVLCSLEKKGPVFSAPWDVAGKPRFEFAPQQSIRSLTQTLIELNLRITRPTPSENCPGPTLIMAVHFCGTMGRGLGMPTGRGRVRCREGDITPPCSNTWPLGVVFTVHSNCASQPLDTTTVVYVHDSSSLPC